MAAKVIWKHDEHQFGDHHAGREGRDRAWPASRPSGTAALSAADEAVVAAAVGEGEAVAPQHPGDHADDG